MRGDQYPPFYVVNWKRVSFKRHEFLNGYDSTISVQQECIPEGCVPSAAVAFSGAGCVCLGNVCPGVSAQRGVCLGGVSPWGLCLPLGDGRRGIYTSPSLWTEFLTHACDNITFPQILFRTVITSNYRQLLRPDKPMSLTVSSIVRGVNEQKRIVNKCPCR